MALISSSSYDNFQAIDATTDVWDKIIATSMHSEYVVRSGTTGGIREADFCNVNLTNASVGGYVTTTKTNKCAGGSDTSVRTQNR